MKNILANQYYSENPELLLNIDNFEPNAHMYYWAACEKKDMQALFVVQIYLHKNIKGYLRVAYLPN